MPATDYADITCGIKTLMRPPCLQRLLLSIQQYYPGIPIVVVDDSPEPREPECPNLKYIKLPYDTGQGKSRNAMVDAIKTPYTLHLDDDFIFNPQTRLDILQAPLDAGMADLVAGQVQERGRFRLFHGLLDLRGDQLIHNRASHGTVEIADRCYERVDIVLNFFLARTSTLQKVRWDEDAKVCTHEEFFVRARDRVRTLYTPEVWCDHEHPRIQTYTNLRKRGADERMTVLAKHGIRELLYVGHWG